MSKRDVTSSVIDTVLKIAVMGGVITTAMAAPNMIQALEKPLDKFLRHMDKRQRERELRRIISYMKTSKLIEGSYQHGLQITAKGRQRLQSRNLAKLQVQPQDCWDGMWRLVLYDIPESHKYGRNALTAKLNKLGFYQLQRSAWLHTFPCRDVIEEVTAHYKIDNYVSYLEILSVDNQTSIVEGFKKRYPNTSF